MSDLDFQSDEFLILLSDALRAGPGSPEWHLAVTTLREQGDVRLDEHRMLIDARQTLESGRQYRSVRRGPGFTSKVLAEIEEEGGDSKRPIPTASVIAIASAAVILLSVVIVAWMLFPTVKPEESLDRLSSVYFLNPALHTRFENSIPTDWTPVGELELQADHGLRVHGKPVGKALGGAIVWSTQLEPYTPVAIETTLRARGPSEDLVAQIFITDRPDYSEDYGVSSHELTWLYRAGQSNVALPGGRVEKLSNAIGDNRGTVNVRILIGQDVAIVEQNGKRIWAGVHQLDAKNPRFVGLRFLTGAGDVDSETLAFTSIKIDRP